MPKGVYQHKKRPDVSIRNRSLEMRGIIPWNKGKKGVQKPYWLGKKRSKETCIKIKKSRKRGKEHPNWKGGKENTLMLNRKRRIMKIGNGGLHTLREWETLKAQYNWTCPCCKKKEPEIKLSEDHIIPLSKGGSDNIENIQPLCRSCNCKKRTKIIKYENRK